MNKQKLASKIWESANELRSKIEASEYKNYILGFIFYKFLSDNEMKFLNDNGFTNDRIKELTEDNKELVEFTQKSIGYFISYDNLFSTWIEKGKAFDVSDVRDGLSAFDRLVDNNSKKLFDKIFSTLTSNDSGLSKLGTNSTEQTSAVLKLLNIIKTIPMSNKQDYDILGFVYEYLIGMFAANAGKKAGEFYTPHEASMVMSEIIAHHLKDKKEISIYDPTSGSGSLLINIGESISKYNDSKDNIKYYAQELKENTYNLTRMNLIMRDIKPHNIIVRNGDTLEQDWPIFDEKDPVNTYNMLSVNAVVSNPPYSQDWNNVEKESDPRYSNYGVAPKGKADYAFLLHDLFHLKSDGIMAIVLPHGVLFRGGDEGKIRKNLIEKNNIDTIIGFPANTFFGTGIPTIIMILKQQRTNDNILFIDASKGFEKNGNKNKLRACDVKKIVDTAIERKELDKYSRIVTREEIRNNDYNLNIPRYIDSSEEKETFNIYTLMNGGIPKEELDNLNKYFNIFNTLKGDLFHQVNEELYEIKSEDYKNTINSNDSINLFKESFKNRFKGFDTLLENQLLNKKYYNPNEIKEVITQELFGRLDNINLIENYEAYQVFINTWNVVSQDLEIISTEGIESINKVEPNMITKKIKNVETEVQEGYVGKIIPFDLIQQNLLKDEYKKIVEYNNRLEEINNKIIEIIETIPEEENSILNEDNTTFLAKKFEKKLKDILEVRTIKKETLKLEKFEEDSFEYNVILVKILKEEEKELKKQIKEKTAILIKNTIEKIETLTQAEQNLLLTEKWINPVISGISKLYDNLIQELTTKIDVLINKYKTSYYDLEKSRKEEEQNLINMLKELTGSDLDMKGINDLISLLNGSIDEK